jgi:hypothetical protein
MASPFSWPVLVPCALRAPAPVNFGVRPLGVSVDVHAFLQIRLDFLGQLYRTSTAPYIERKRLIETGQSPYEPPYSEDDEPPFLSEWLEADQSLRVLGQMFISAIAASLQLYIKESLQNMRRRVRHQKMKDVRPTEEYKKVFKAEGWLGGYKAYFSEQFGIEFSKSGCDLNILEGLVLARNRSQHPDTITSLDVRHSEHDLQKTPIPFFVDQREIEAMGDDQFPPFFYEPTVTAKPEHIEAAINEAGRFCIWLERSIWEWSAS